MKKIIATASGLSLSFLSISSVFAEDITVNVSPPTNLKINDLGKLLSGTIGAVLVLAALATFVYLIWGGIDWILSGGDKGKVETAQHRIQAALLGLFIVFASWAIFLIVEQFFGVSILRGISIPKPF